MYRGELEKMDPRFRVFGNLFSLVTRLARFISFSQIRCAVRFCESAENIWMAFAEKRG